MSADPRSYEPVFEELRDGLAGGGVLGIDGRVYSMPADAETAHHILHRHFPSLLRTPLYPRAMELLTAGYEPPPPPLVPLNVPPPLDHRAEIAAAEARIRIETARLNAEFARAQAAAAAEAERSRSPLHRYMGGSGPGKRYGRPRTAATHHQPKGETTYGRHQGTPEVGQGSPEQTGPQASQKVA